MAYRDYEKKTFDAWDIDDDNPGTVKAGSDGNLFGFVSGHLPISVADSDAVAQQIIKSHQEKLKTSSSLDSNSSPTSTNNSKPKGSGKPKLKCPYYFIYLFKKI